MAINSTCAREGTKEEGVNDVSLIGLHLDLSPELLPDLYGLFILIFLFILLERFGKLPSVGLALCGEQFVCSLVVLFLENLFDEVDFRQSIAALSWRLGHLT